MLKKICYVTQLHSELYVLIQMMMLTEMRKYTFLLMLDPNKVGEMGYSLLSVFNDRRITWRKTTSVSIKGSFEQPHPSLVSVSCATPNLGVQLT